MGKEKGPCSDEQGPIILLYFSSSPGESEGKDFCPGEKYWVAPK